MRGLAVCDLEVEGPVHFRFKRCDLFLAVTIVFVGMTGYAPLAAAQASEAAFLNENEAAMNKMMAGMAVKPTGAIDRDFVAMMVPHHQGAIDMAQAELLYGHNQKLLRISQEIVVEQLQEIAAMRLAIGEPASPTWVIDKSQKPAESAIPGSASALAGEGLYLHQTDAAMDKMMADMSVKPTGDVDRDFVAMMVPHHQGAIDMAKAEFQYGSDQKLKAIAQEIIVDQMQEITLMRLAVGEPLPADQPSPTQAPSQTSGAGQTQMQMSPGMHMSPVTNGNAN
jgi:uncharacterized protein (DUF305 family)